MTGTIGRAVSSWFDCNKHWLVPVLLATVVALIVTEVLTGGAITAALPAILEVFGAIMIGYSAIRAGGFIAAYVAQAMNGDVASAARSLARGLAIASIEIVSELAFPAAGAALRGTTGAVKGVAKGVGRAVRATSRGVGHVARTTRRGMSRGVSAAQRAGSRLSRGFGRFGRGLGRAAQPIIRSGKVFIRSVDDAITRGVRTIQDLYQRLRQQMREFLSFSFTVRHRRFYLWAHYNPTVLLATGELETVSVSGARPTRGMEVELIDDPHAFGIIVGVNDETASAAVRALQDMPDDATRRAFFESIEEVSEAERRAAIQALAGGSSNRISTPGRLRNLLEEAHGTHPHHQAHHLLPDAVVRDHDLTAEAIRRGIYDIDNVDNGIFLPSDPAGRRLTPDLPYHFGSHPRWNRFAQTELDSIQEILIRHYGSLDAVPDDIMREMLVRTQRRLRSEIARWPTTASRGGN